MPINRTLTALAYRRITVCSGHVVGEAAFVDIDDWTSAAPGSLAKRLPLPFIGFGMAQRFFYGLCSDA